MTLALEFLNLEEKIGDIHVYSDGVREYYVSSYVTCDEVLESLNDDPRRVQISTYEGDVGAFFSSSSCGDVQEDRSLERRGTVGYVRG